MDDGPTLRREVFSYAHKLISEKWPSKIKKVASPATNELLTGEVSLRGEKRVVNEHMKKELGVRLLHPSYRSGLLTICDQLHTISSLIINSHGKGNHAAQLCKLSNVQSTPYLSLFITQYSS